MSREKLSNAVFWVAVAFVIKYLDVNMFGLNLLPDWLGFVILACQIETLSEVHDDIKLLKPLAKLLALWTVACALLSFFGLELNLYPGSLIGSVLWMYLQFQLLTDLAQVAREGEYPQWQRMLQLRTALTLVATAGALPLDWEAGGVVVIGLNIVFVVAAVWLFRVLLAFGEYLDPRDAEELRFSQTLKEHQEGEG